MFIFFFCLNNAQYVIYGNNTNKQWIELNYTELWQEPIGSWLWLTNDKWGMRPGSGVYHLVPVLHECCYSQVKSSGRKNVLRKLLRVLYRMLKAGFSVCWLSSTVCLFVTERVLTKTEWNAQGVNVCSSKSLFTFVWFLFFVTWKLLWTRNNQC